MYKTSTASFNTVNMPRDPNETQAWLVGSGIASLAAAVYLIRDAKMMATNIHILDVHDGTGGGIRSCGNAEHGYVLYAGSLPYFHDKCVDELLSLVPSAKAANKTILGTIYDFEREEVPKPPEHAATRILRQGDKGLEKVEANQLHIGCQQRLELIKIMLQSERSLGSQSIEAFFDKSFFKSNFWILWSTT